jgi:hypothetical protein
MDEQETESSNEKYKPTYSRPQNGHKLQLSSCDEPLQSALSMDQSNWILINENTYRVLQKPHVSLSFPVWSQ